LLMCFMVGTPCSPPRWVAGKGFGRAVRGWGQTILIRGYGY